MKNPSLALLGFVGYKLTWTSNRREDDHTFVEPRELSFIPLPKMNERLDQAVANARWRAKFQSFQCINLDMMIREGHVPFR